MLLGAAPAPLRGGRGRIAGPWTPGWPGSDGPSRIRGVRDRPLRLRGIGVGQHPRRRVARDEAAQGPIRRSMRLHPSPMSVIQSSMMPPPRSSSRSTTHRPPQHGVDGRAIVGKQRCRQPRIDALTDRAHRHGRASAGPIHQNGLADRPRSRAGCTSGIAHHGTGTPVVDAGSQGRVEFGHVAEPSRVARQS